MRIRDLAAMSSADGGVLLVFGISPPVPVEALGTFRPTAEATERIVLTEPVELAFRLHTEALRRYLGAPTAQIAPDGRSS